MLNVRDLEQRWLKYKIKSYYPYLFGILTTLLLIIGITLYVNHNSSKEIVTTTVVKKKINNPQKKLHVNTKSPVPTNTLTTPKIVEKPPKKLEPVLTTQLADKQIIKDKYTPQRLEPSFSFLNTIDSPPENTIQAKTQKKKTINTIITPATEEEVAKIEEKQQKIKPKPKLQTPLGIKIDRTKTQKEIQDIIRRFKENKNPALGLYLARYYYKIKNYQKSYNYALDTNHIDSNIEESWLIFASSQVKLGKKDAAVKTLIAYIKNSDSINAKSLLRSIRNGEFQ